MKIIININKNKHGDTPISQYIITLIFGFLDLDYEVSLPCDNNIVIQDFFKNRLRSYSKFNKIPYDGIDYTNYDYILTDISRFNRDVQEDVNKWNELNKKIIDCNLSERHAFLQFSDCSNRGYLPGEIYSNFPCRTFVKRETSVKEFPDVLPLDMGAFPEWKQDLKRDIFVSCLFGGNSGSRTKGYPRLQIAQHVKDNFPESPVYLGASKALNHTNYFNLLNRSKISVSCWGAGYSCYRDWEILSCDTILAYKRMPNPHLDDYIDMKSCIEYDYAKELIGKLKFLKDKPLEIEKIRNNSIKITKEINLPIHRAKKLINAIKTGTPKPSWVK